MTEAKEGIARSFGYIGIALGVIGLIFVLSAEAPRIFYGDVLLPSGVFGSLAILVGSIGLVHATKKEKNLCYSAIILGFIVLILWAIALQLLREIP